MKQYFKRLSEQLFSTLHSDEVLLLNYKGENSDFARLNHHLIRQCGFVRQQSIGLKLVYGNRQGELSLQLCGEWEQDWDRVTRELSLLRQNLRVVPDDPYIYYSSQVNNSDVIGDVSLPQPQGVIEQVCHCARDLDLVGIWASGEICRGFSNSLGQFNWHSQHNFNFDWSVYLCDDKAVKQSYAGEIWDQAAFESKLNQAREILPVLAGKAKSVPPGRYRVYLAPSAVNEILDLLAWGGFGLKSHKTAQSPLLKMSKEGKTLAQSLTLLENHAEGVGPMFTSSGFIKPDQVTLIDQGVYGECLSTARSAREYGAPVNAASEAPQSLQMVAGELEQAQVLNALDTGIWISNLWYCNYSDRNNARITGMTRYACTWVENGKVVAPLSAMRFDETIYNMFGANLEALTRERELLLDNCTYEQRSDASALLPGMLVRDFNLSL